MTLFGYELTIKKKPKMARKKHARRQWTASETNTALRLRSEGKSFEEIGELMNRTRQSVYSHLWKLRSKK